MEIVIPMVNELMSEFRAEIAGIHSINRLKFTPKLRISKWRYTDGNIEIAHAHTPTHADDSPHTLFTPNKRKNSNYITYGQSSDVPKRSPFYAN